MPGDLARQLLDRDRAAVPDALNLVDDDRPQRRQQARVLLDELERHRTEFAALRVGITGAPGAGKSTLLDALVRALRDAERSVGILAIDPSSQQTGGALLGDRFHVRSGAVAAVVTRPRGLLAISYAMAPSACRTREYSPGLLRITPLRSPGPRGNTRASIVTASVISRAASASAAVTSR